MAGRLRKNEPLQLFQVVLAVYGLKYIRFNIHEQENRTIKIYNATYFDFTR